MGCIGKRICGADCRTTFIEQHNGAVRRATSEPTLHRARHPTKIRRGWQSVIMPASSAGACANRAARRCSLGHKRQMKAAQRMELGARRRNGPGLDAGVSNEQADKLDLVQQFLPVILANDPREFAKNDAAHPRAQLGKMSQENGHEDKTAARAAGKEPSTAPRAEQILLSAADTFPRKYAGTQRILDTCARTTSFKKRAHAAITFNCGTTSTPMPSRTESASGPASP